MDILLWIIFGGIVGWVASLIMGTDGQQGLIANIVVGIIGAIIGGWLMNLVGNNASASGFNLPSFLVALLGSVVLIAILKMIRK
jgi:uncharacterized membrane protein YeaQ/YmgE (transglycosylase-associated protein family)